MREPSAVASIAKPRETSQDDLPAGYHGTRGQHDIGKPRGRDSLLFVYGTLRPFVDIEMAPWVADARALYGRGTTPGRLYDLGATPE